MVKCFYIFIWIAVFRLCNSHRKMGLGNESILGKHYLVYFVKSPFSKADDEAWICAGAIVSPTQILTAAACLVEVDKIYAIAGYKKYIHGNDIENDECTKRWKRKIVKVSVPKEYKMVAKKQPDWMNIDVGVATVDKPYNFTDLANLGNCSYVPQNITINYDKKNELENIRAIALGWGGIKVKQPKESTKMKNRPQILKEASTTIINKTVCTNLVKGNVSKEMLSKYMLCASGNGFDVEDGVAEEASDGCSFNSTESGCVDENFDVLRRRKNEKSNGNVTNIVTKQPQLHKTNKTNSRRSPLIETCQNDHGGPLTTWIGTQEMVLGVALNGISNPNFDCVGPRIYVSTTETAKIIKCLLETNETKRNICNNDNKGHQVYDIEITWPKDKQQNTSTNNKQKISPFLRQGNEEQPLHVRPTKDLENIDDHGNPLRSPQLAIPVDQFYDSQTSTVNPYFQIQNQQAGYMAPTNVQQYGEQSQGQMQQTMEVNQQQFNSLSQSQISAFNQPQPSAYQPQMESFNQQPMESLNQQSDSFSQQQPYYNQQPQQSFGSQNQQAVENFNQQAPSYNNQPQVESVNAPQMGNFDQPQTGSQNQPPNDAFNSQMTAFQNQPQRDTFNQPPQEVLNQSAKETFNPPTMETKSQPQTEPLSSPNQSQLDAFNQPMALPDQMQMRSPDQQQMGSLDQSQVGPNQQQMGSPNQQPMDSLNQPQIGSSFQTPVDQFGQPQTSFNQPPNESNPAPVDPFNQSQMNSYYQQQMSSQNQPIAEGNNQPQGPFDNQPQGSFDNQPQGRFDNQPQGSFDNQPQGSFNNQQLNLSYEAATYAPGQGDSFNQQQSDPNQQSQFQAQQAPQSDPFSQQNMDPMKQNTGNSYIQQQMDPLNQNPASPYMQQQVDQFQQPQKDSFNQQPAESYGQPRSDLVKFSQTNPLQPGQTDPLQSGQTDPYKTAPNDPYKRQPDQSYNQPQDPFKKVDSMQGQQQKMQPFNQQQDSYAQSSYSNPQIESFKPPPADTEDTYNPLAFLNQNYDDPYRMPKQNSFKPQLVEPYKQQNSDNYNNQQPFKPAPVEPYGQPHSMLHDKGQSRSPQSVQSLQPFVQSKIPGSSLTFSASNMHSILRERPSPPNEPDPSRGETQTFEQMYSQMHGSGSDPAQQGVTEQTFEDIYKTLHDGSPDLPHELQFDSRFDQPLEQQFEQNESPTMLSVPRAADGNDEIRVRPQVPLELPDYASYDVRRRNNNNTHSVTTKS